MVSKEGHAAAALAQKHVAQQAQIDELAAAKEALDASAPSRSSAPTPVAMAGAGHATAEALLPPATPSPDLVLARYHPSPTHRQ